MEIKYFTIESHESLTVFLRRIRFSVSNINDYVIQTISPSMGKGIRVITLVCNLTSVKIEVDNYMLEDVKKHFVTLVMNPRAIKSVRRSDGLGDIGDLYK